MGIMPTVRNALTVATSLLGKGMFYLRMYTMLESSVLGRYGLHHVSAVRVHGMVEKNWDQRKTSPNIGSFM